VKSAIANNLRTLANETEREAEKLLHEANSLAAPTAVLREYRSLVLLAQWARQRSLALEGQEITK